MDPASGDKSEHKSRSVDHSLQGERITIGTTQPSNLKPVWDRDTAAESSTGRNYRR